MNEQTWTTHRVTMPDDMALEYLDKLLVVVNKQFLDPGFPIALSMAIDKMRTPLPDNKALTVEELRGMGGKPVWVVCLYPKGQFWHKDQWVICGISLAEEVLISLDNNVLIEVDCGKGWLAYRRQPEKGE